MTAKRFTINGKEIIQNKQVWCMADSEHCADVIATAINELLEEKEILELQLKSATNEIDKLMDEINILTDTCHDCCKEIREENEQLKQFIQELATKGTGKIHLANGSIYKVDAILIDLKR